MVSHLLGWRDQGGWNTRWVGVVVHSQFHRCDIGACIAKSKTSKDLLNVGLLSQGDGLVLKITHDADSEKPIDVAEIDKLEMLVELGFGFGWESTRICDNSEVVCGGGEYEKSVAINLVKGSLISNGDFETK